MSRYYDPVTHRFVNADGYFQSGGDILDSNMSAYCGNNPIVRADPSGEFWVALIAVAVITSIVVLNGCTNKTNNSNSSTPSNYKNVSTPNHLIILTECITIKVFIQHPKYPVLLCVI